jgi:hypothetical protein
MTNVSKIDCQKFVGLVGPFRGVAVAFFCVFLAAGCGREEKIDPSIENLGRATGPVQPMKKDARMKEAMMKRQMGAAPTPEGSGKVHRGTVLETIDVPNYTYIHFQNAASEKQWAAVPLNDKVKKGQSITLIESLVMKDFPSRSLGRTFASIIFGVIGSPETAAEKPVAKPAETAGDAGPQASPPAQPGLPPGHPPINAR